MSIASITAVVACDACGTRFSVDLDAAYKPPAGWSLHEVAEDAVRGGGGELLDSCSVQDGQTLCAACTRQADAATAVVCTECGWDGDASDLHDEGQCPKGCPASALSPAVAAAS